MFEQLKYNLKHNRKSVMKRVTAWLIFSAIILVFVFWGLNKQQGQGVASGGAAITVNDSIVSLFEFNEAMERARRDPRFEQIQALGGDAGRQILQQQVASQLVEMSLLRQETDRERIWTPDAEVRDILMAVPQFQQDGKFSPVLYHNYLDGTRKVAADLENDIRRDQAVQRLVSLFSASLKPMKIEDEKVKALKALKANLEYVAVQTDSLVLPTSIGEAAEKSFAALAANEPKIKDYFETHKAEFSAPERVKVRHILIRAKSGDAESEKKALAKVEDLAQRAKKEDFAKLATENSEDPGSKAKGGLIDYFSRGKMVPQFETAAFSQPVNEIGAPVKTDYGYHLIQVLDKKAATSRNLDEVKLEIAGILLAKEQSQAAVDKLQSELKAGNTVGVNQFVTEHKLKWEETGAFSIDAESVPKLGGNDQIIQAAFRLSPAKPYNEGLIHDGQRTLVLRYKALPADKPVAAAKGKAAAPAFENDEMLNEMAANRRAQEPLRKWLEGLRKSAKVSSNAQVFKGQQAAPESD